MTSYNFFYTIGALWVSEIIMVASPWIVIINPGEVPDIYIKEEPKMGEFARPDL